MNVGQQQTVAKCRLWGFGNESVSCGVCGMLGLGEVDVECAEPSSPSRSTTRTTGFKYSVGHQATPRSRITLTDADNIEVSACPRSALRFHGLPRLHGGAHIQCQQLAAEGIAWMLKPLATWSTMSRTHLGVVGPYSSRTGFTSEPGDWESAGDVTHLGSSVPAPKWRNRSHVTNYMSAGQAVIVCQDCVG